MVFTRLQKSASTIADHLLGRAMFKNNFLYYKFGNFDCFSGGQCFCNDESCQVVCAENDPSVSTSSDGEATKQINTDFSKGYVGWLYWLKSSWRKLRWSLSSLAFFAMQDVSSGASV
ncbi:hypothetical protein AVEN_183238-1 [Araneus ventricosus]|uniref:Uncharacterized protein n=1 Tax=Araneus ventricosus TaxID=182803 RepID=A0A4Y2MJG4_ARAVE|nr:hypothetical protein AVEN_183238-1 [Araneus ventricosus]